LLSLVVSAAGLFSQPKPVLISPETQFQRVEGFGITLGNGSAREINSLPTADHERLLMILFGPAGARFNIVRSEIWWTGKRLPFTSPLYIGGLTFTFSDEDNETAQYSLIREAQKLNELVVDSCVWTPPPHWKTNNSTVQGGELLGKQYENFADYLLGYLLYYKRMRNFSVQLLSLQNEPDKSSAHQSCLWEAGNLKDFAKLVAARLRQAGFSPQLLLPEVEWGKAMDYLKPFSDDPDARMLLSRIGVHSSPGVNPARELLRDFCRRQNLKLWVSEFAMPSDGSMEPIDSGLKLAETLVHDLVEGDCSAWIFWVPMATSGWTGRESLIDRQNGSFKATKRLWCISQFSRFVPRDAVRISAVNTELPMVAFRTPEYKGIVLVMINPQSRSVTQDVELRNWTMERITGYRTSEKEDGAQMVVSGESGPRQSFVLEPRSVTTVLAQIRRVSRSTN
jgi:glucosylceramidase